MGMHQSLTASHSSIHHFLGRVAGQIVHEKEDDQPEREDNERRDDLPFEVLPDDVLARLQRVHEPQERRIGPAETKQRKE